jgi:pimeloyl-ACP methyl ester carboxylesterase
LTRRLFAPGERPRAIRPATGFYASSRLALQPGVDPARLVVAGLSRGSEAAQLLGVHYPKLVHAVVALVPSNQIFCDIAQNTTGCAGPAFLRSL